MAPSVFETTLAWIEAVTPPHQPLEITFHGGEPLLVGYNWYQQNLPRLKHRFGSRLRLHLQSNLWLLDEAFCELFKAHQVSIGTSLDGPEQINDRQRGPGYFRKTMAGINLARRFGLPVGLICTFTAASAAHYREIFEFFAGQGLTFSLHAAACGLNGGSQAGVTLPAEAQADLLEAAFDYYLANLSRMQISTFDAIARSVSANQGSICTFANCLGSYLAIDPVGDIYPCNRFIPNPEWRLGQVQANPSLETLSHAPAWQQLRQRELAIEAGCGDCIHFAYCRGGCAYAAAAAGHHGPDPACPAYRRLFDRLIDRALAEVLAEENLNRVVDHGPNKYGLLQKGPLLQLMRAGSHPKETAAKARETVAAVALASCSAPAQAVTRLDRAGLVTDPNLARQSVAGLQNRLRHQSDGLANLYLHVTYTCNLSCNHCYAQSGPDQATPAMPVARVDQLLRQAAGSGFTKLIITGGEPLLHPQRLVLLETLAGLREVVKPMRIVLRTNLAYPLSSPLRKVLLNSADQVMVSLDGDRATHDARRGAGTCDRIVENLRSLKSARPGAAVGLTAVLSPAQIKGTPGQAVRTLGRELNLPVRFKPELPLGRAAANSIPLTYYTSLDDDDSFDDILARARPAATCGLGTNLYVGPGGDCYPCHALMHPRHLLGNLFETDLVDLLAGDHFQSYRAVTVDSNRQCARCELRYLCGGFCRAWTREAAPDTPPPDCTALHHRAGRTLLSALETLEITPDRWLAAGLPLPTAPPVSPRS